MLLIFSLILSVLFFLIYIKKEDKCNLYLSIFFSCTILRETLFTNNTVYSDFIYFIQTIILVFTTYIFVKRKKQIKNKKK